MEEWNNLSLQTEFTVSRKKFVEFTEKYRELLETLKAKDNDPDKQHYYLMTSAFQIEELLFKKDK